MPDRETAGTQRVQVFCNDRQESFYQELDYKPDADIYRATCCMCGAAEYREPEGIEG